MNTNLELTKAQEITKADIECFNAYLAEGVEAWVKAGQLLVKMVERNPNAYGIIVANNPHLSIDLLLAFEKIGRNEIFPYVLLDKSPGSRQLLALPYDIQVKHYKEPVEVVAKIIDGKPVVEKRLVSNLSKEEVQIVFGPNGIRSTAEQTELLKAAPSIAPLRKKYTRHQKLVGYCKVTNGKDGKITYEPVAYFPTSQCTKAFLGDDGTVVLAIYKHV